jgi:menaquinone-dependent protoporphyrinogen oxidase
MAAILLLYASHFGQTRAIATRIADRLRDAGHDVDLVDARSKHVPPVEDYDLVVMGSRVELGRHASEIHNYMASNAAELAARPTVVFSVSMSAARPASGPDPNGYLGTLFEDVGWTPSRAVAFGGALPYRKYNFLLRWIMKRISKSGGHTTDTSKNHEFTDWTAVDKLADNIAAMAKVDERMVSRL